MVMTWLHQVVALRSSEQQENSGVKFELTYFEEEILYDKLIILWEDYFRGKIKVIYEEKDEASPGYLKMVKRMHRSKTYSEK